MIVNLSPNLLKTDYLRLQGVVWFPKDGYREIKKLFNPLMYDELGGSMSISQRLFEIFSAHQKGSFVALFSAETPAYLVSSIENLFLDMQLVVVYYTRRHFYMPEQFYPLLTKIKTEIQSGDLAREKCYNQLLNLLQKG